MNIPAEIIIKTYELTDAINSAKVVEEYLRCKAIMETEVEVQELGEQFKKAKAIFTEVQRFGSFHPDYDVSKRSVDKILKDIKKKDAVINFLEAESKLNELLGLVSSTLAKAVSDSIKVPEADRIFADDSCITGSCNSCGIKDRCAI